MDRLSEKILTGQHGKLTICLDNCRITIYTIYRLAASLKKERNNNQVKKSAQEMKERQTDRQTETDRQTDRNRDRRTDRQTDRNRKATALHVQFLHVEVMIA